MTELVYTRRAAKKNIILTKFHRIWQEYAFADLCQDITIDTSQFDFTLTKPEITEETNMV